LRPKASLICRKEPRTKGVMEKTKNKQEGQHPLTGQRAANFRLLANQ